MNETWRPVPGFEGRYEVSDLGRVAKLPDRRILKLTPMRSRGGYLFANLNDGSRWRPVKVHHMVCGAFNGPRPDGFLTRHLDGNHLNNTPGNLSWGTASENQHDKVRHGTHHNAIKTECINRHPLAGANLYVNATSGARQCRTCQRAAKQRHAERKRTTR